ncbi:MAG TPA: glycoside hydrolase family 88 protein [Opitutaceae bacterium]|nr:glycoside hydrolase family 88 protein [Opitutaceae bacterium]
MPPRPFLAPLRVALVIAAFVAPLARAAEPPLADVIRDDFAFAAAQYSTLLANVAGDPRLPRTAEAGRVVTVAPEDWTSGFFPGSLWLLFEHTGDPKWKTAAEDYTARLESLRHFAGHHDIGFMLGCSYGQGLRLTSRAEYRAVLIDGAQALATRFRPGAGVIRSWDFGPWRCPVIVDNMMNLELLLWAAREGGDTRLRDIALSHADRTLANHYRADASCFHVVDYDPATGAVLAKQTAQGNADSSAWARGQAWGLYGFTLMYRETRRPEYLAHAHRIARFLLGHPRLPADKIPYWDFDAPGIPAAPRDTSAAAVMCSALVELAGYAEPAMAREYLSVAETQLRALSSPTYRAALGENGGFLLLHAVGHMPERREIDVPLVYGDYYFLEALARFAARSRER